MTTSPERKSYAEVVAAGKQAYYHTAFLVHDLDKAIPLFSEALDLSFHQPTPHEIEFMEDPEVHHQTVTVSYSWEAPHIELLEAGGNGLINPDKGEGLHHYGVWVENAHAHMQSKNALGIRTEARILHKTDSGDLTTLFWFNRPEDLGGIRIEFVDDMLRPEVEDWLANDTAHLDID